MADQKISAMPAASTLDGTELAPLVQGGANVRTTLTAINALSQNRIALFRNTTYTYTAANTAEIITFDNTAIAQNITLVDNSKITFSVAGEYLLNFNFQMANTDSQEGSCEFWVRLNGVDFPGSNTRFDVPSSHGGNPGRIVASFTLPGIAAVNDYVQLVSFTTKTEISIISVGPQVSPTRPSTPAGVVVVHQIGS